jgi:hypothetical protein
MDHFNINSAGFVIAGMFIATWLAAVLIWRFGRIEQKWAVRLQPARPGGSPVPPATTRAPLRLVRRAGSVGPKRLRAPLPDDRRDDASSAPAARQNR